MSSPRSLREHIRIAAAAVSQGLVDDLEALELLRVAAQGTHGSVDEVWLEAGKLSRAQLDSVRLAMSAGPPSSAEHATLLGRAAEARRLDPRMPVETETGDSVVGADGGRRPSASPAAFGATLAVTTAGDPATLARPDLSPLYAAATVATSMEGAVDPAASASVHASPTRYRKVGHLGAGGLAEVGAYVDTVLGRMVAVKTSRRDLPSSVGARAMLEREARIISTLEHPNIIPVYDAGVQSDVGPFYVMRSVSQSSLEDLLDRLRSRQPEVLREHTLGRLLRTFVQICHAVDFAHSRGVIHCDLKPANVLLGGYGEVLVVDWGMAQSAQFPSSIRGGTPGYMAPEQYEVHRATFDARTDVFALGAILYQVMCLQPPFVERRAEGESATRTGVPGAPYDPPRRPGTLSPPHELPTELEEICLRALEFDPAARYPNARALADAIEEHLEGTRERERRRLEAERYTATGDELAERCREFMESRPEQNALLQELRAATRPHDPVEEKQDLWDAEDALAVTDALRVRTLQAAATAYEQALDAVPSHAPARRGLSRLYHAELERARQLRSQQDEVYFEQLLRQYDDGEFVNGLRRQGRLRLAARNLGRGVELHLCTLREQKRRIVIVGEQRIAPIAEQSLSPGSYAISVRQGGRERSRFPLLVEPGAEVALSIDLALVEALGPGELLVAGGRTLLGGDRKSLDAEEPRIADVPAFAIQRAPVRFREYLAFIARLVEAGDPAADEHLPRTRGGLPYFRVRDGRTEPELIKRIAAEPEPLDLPVIGVSAASAEAYAAHLSAIASSGSGGSRRFRLPTEHEWEKAARGPDGRFYPWGNHFDATFCKLRHSRPGTAEPEPSGRFLADESPYALVDLAGGVADWVLPESPVARPTEERRVSSRGGAWCDWESDARLTSRREYVATERSERVGFRLVRELPQP